MNNDAGDARRSLQRPGNGGGSASTAAPPVPVTPPPGAPHPPERPQETRISPSPGPNLPDLCHVSKHFVCKLSGRGVGALTCHVPRWSLCCPDPRVLEWLGWLGVGLRKRAGHPHAQIITSSSHLRASIQRCSDSEFYVYECVGLSWQTNLVALAALSLMWYVRVHAMCSLKLPFSTRQTLPT